MADREWLKRVLKTIFEEKKPNGTQNPLPHLNAEVIKNFHFYFWSPPLRFRKDEQRLSAVNEKGIFE